MACPDVAIFRKFYSSRLGGIAQHYVRLALTEWAEKLNGHNVIGVGYTTPYLEPFFGQKNRVIAVVPTSEGEVHWSYPEPRLVAAAQELELPFADGSVDLILLTHSLEYAENPKHLMQEMWRVLSPSGQLVVIVPNRQGVWTRADSTPFGSGRPYSASQLSELFEEALLSPIHMQTLLFTPPTDRIISRPHQLIEAVGKHILPGFGGVLLGCAKKQVYALNKKKRAASSKKPRFVPAIGSAMDSSSRS